MKKKLAVILGPTATGKSHCGIALAKALDGEIISGDSMLVYRGMDIGTAKPTAEELAAVPHHMVDILPPEASFNVVDFKERAERLIDEITARGRLPIIVGGTGLYIKALLENYHFNSAGENAVLRQELENLLAEQGKEALFVRLQKAAPQEAERIDINNTRRVIRAIEAAESGDNLSHSSDGELAYDAVVLACAWSAACCTGALTAAWILCWSRGCWTKPKNCWTQACLHRRNPCRLSATARQ